MAERADFNAEVKRALAERAGFRCSFPTCRVSTIGPGDETPTSSNRTGMACHIAAASGGPGARRVVSSMTREEIADFDNGIWMCYRHGKLIDGDEERFTISQLKTWKVIAEHHARLSHEFGRDVHPSDVARLRIPLPESAIQLPGLGKENELIGNALHDSCIGDIWGIDVLDAIRDVAIEIVRNAFQHGGATEFTLKIEPQKVVLVDNGSRFSVESLRQTGGRGGALAVRNLLDNHGEGLVFSGNHLGGLNEIVIAFVSRPDDLVRLTPCMVSLDIQTLHNTEFNIPVIDGCDAMYLLLPKFASPSDVGMLELVLSREPHASQQYVLVANHVSSLVLSGLESLPNCRVMRLHE